MVDACRVCYLVPVSCRRQTRGMILVACGVLAACAENWVAVEINASPYRLDLDWRWARRALDLGLKLAVNPDAHSTAGLDDVRWGVAVARKAGATAADLINCAPIDDFLEQP